MCISFWVRLSQPPCPLWPLVTLTNCLAGASPIFAPILIVYRSLLCYVTFFFQLYNVFQKQTQKFSIFFGFPFPAEMLTTKDSLSTALTSTIKTPDWPNLDRVSFENGNTVNVDMNSNYIFAWVFDSLFLMIWLVIFLVISTNREKWWIELSPTFIFVVFNIVLGLVGTLWPKPLRKFVTPPRALIDRPFCA